MPSCAIVTCKHRSESSNFHTDGITFHRFPSNPEVKQKWITATAKGPVWLPVKRSTICSVHFEENQFRPLPNSRRLFDWAVPILKLPLLPSTLSPKHDVVLMPNELDMDDSKKLSEVLQMKSDKVSDSDNKMASKTSTVTRELQSVKITTKQEELRSLQVDSVTTKNCKDLKCVKPDETPRKMRLQIENYRSLIQQKNRKIITLQKTTSRYRKRIVNLKNILNDKLKSRLP